MGAGYRRLVLGRLSRITWRICVAHQLSVHTRLGIRSHTVLKLTIIVDTGSLPLPPICLAALRDQHDAQSVAEAEAGMAWHDNGPVITTKFGTPIEPRNFLRFWDRRCERSSVRRITVHDARRTCGSLLADPDVHPRVAMQVLRHANFKITMEIYTQVTDQQTRDALKRLGDSLG